MVKNKTTLFQGLWLVALLAVLTLASCQNRKPQAADSAKQENVKVVSELTAASFVDKVFDYTQPADSVVKLAGKLPVIVDFYATWCGPCRMANKAMLPLKEELKGKDIVYLYITGETSPLKTWENMIPDIHGEHFRLTDAQWSFLGDKFDIRGVPTYLIIDREGNVKHQKTGFPGVAQIKEELMKVYD